MHNVAISKRDGVNISQLAILQAELVTIRRHRKVLKDTQNIYRPICLINNVPSVRIWRLVIVRRDPGLTGVVRAAVAGVN